MILYLMTFRYIFGNKQFSSATSMLSTSARSISSNFLSSPEKIENVIGLVRTAAPFTSAQTVSKINTYLPMIEKTSTLLGMYSFLNRAQNYAPIEPLSGKSSMEKITSLMMKNKAPLGKMIAQPMLANGMEKIMANAMKDMVKNVNLGDLLTTISNTANSQGGKNSKTQNTEMDINSLLQTFMPLLNNMMSSDENNTDDHHNDDNDYIDDYNDDGQKDDYKNNYEHKANYQANENHFDDHSEYVDNKHLNNNKNQSSTSSNKKTDTYNSRNNSEINEKPKPIRIRQKRYKY